MKKMNITQRPKIAIIDTNTLAVMGLRQILQEVMPVMVVDVFGSLEEVECIGEIDSYYHYFVSMNIVINNHQFFVARRHKTIVLTTSTDPNMLLRDFHSLCINVSEEALVRSILILEQQAHGHGKNLPPIVEKLQTNILTNREIEVLALIVKGFINKEIADHLNIGLTTVISHRKNIVEKLGLKSVSALTVYAVMHGYVVIDEVKR